MKIYSKMKATRLKYLIVALAYLVFIFLFLAGCTPDNQNYQTSKEIQPFVRFNLTVDNNNIPFEFPEIPDNDVAVNEFTKESIRTLKIPVALTYFNLEESINVDFNWSAEGDADGFKIEPDVLEFEPGKLVDTIAISFNKRWENGNQITLKLTNSSDPEVNIGNLNNSNRNDELTISLGELNTTYSLLENRIELQGDAGETAQFEVRFPNGYFPEEIKEKEIFSFLNDFDYDLTRIEEKENSILYEIQLNEDLSNDDIPYQSLISLKNTEKYSTTGNTRLLVIKPILTERDKTVNPAANFYDVTDNFYRTYGENWLDHDNDGICEWRNFFAFTQPIRVDSDHPNAVLYSDNDTSDESDDIYYDAFRIGFSSPLEGRTTNPFNLQRWFDNESTDALESPGFNITPALEFFPSSGDNPNEGIVQVVSQFLIISSRDGVTYELAISGSGTYAKKADGIFEIHLTLNVENQELFGGKVSSEYFIYNSRDYNDLEPLTTNSCVNEIEI